MVPARWIGPRADRVPHLNFVKGEALPGQGASRAILFQRVVNRRELAVKVGAEAVDDRDDRQRDATISAIRGLFGIVC